MTSSCLARNEPSISLIGFIRQVWRKKQSCWRLDSFDGQEAEETSATRGHWHSRSVAVELICVHYDRNVDTAVAQHPQAVHTHDVPLHRQWAVRQTLWIAKKHNELVNGAHKTNSHQGPCSATISCLHISIDGCPVRLI